MEAEVNGVDTIRDLSGEPPQEIDIPYKLMSKQQILMIAWNACFIATIPYCYKCKVPLVWHSNPEGKVLFHCPKCKRNWIKGEGWDKKDA
jgi:hypothetical protein